MVAQFGENANIKFHTYSPTYCVTYRFFANIHFSPTLEQSINDDLGRSSLIKNFVLRSEPSISSSCCFPNTWLKSNDWTYIRYAASYAAYHIHVRSFDLSYATYRMHQFVWVRAEYVIARYFQNFVMWPLSKPRTNFLK